MRSRFLCILASATALMTAAVPAIPCDCVCQGQTLDVSSASQAARDALRARRVVVLGRVVRLEPDPARTNDPLPDALERVATLEVTREWKGPHERTYALVSALSSASCGYPFRIGEYFLLMFDDEPERPSSCCGKGTVANMRLLITALDKAAGRQALEIPADLN